MLDTWLLTPAQKLAQKAFRDAVDEYGEPACRQEPEMFEEILPDETGQSHSRKMFREWRIAYAQRKCVSCPLFAECEDVHLTDDKIVGVIAGRLVESPREREKAS